jgi:hypothetical protein
MDTNKLIKILRSLADGIDPYTGEIFENGSPYNHPDTVRALYKAIELFKDSYSNTKKEEEKYLPEWVGEKWTKEEDIELLREFEEKISISELAKIHGRTRGAITSRLIKLGKISSLN